MPHTETIVDGVWHPSVTTITSSEEKPWITKWQVKWGQLAVDKLNITSAIGDEFHRCAEEWLNGREFSVRAPVRDDTQKPMPSCIPRIKRMVDAFVAFMETLDGEVTATEKKVISRKYFYSGTMDAKGKLTHQCIARLENEA